MREFLEEDWFSQDPSLSIDEDLFYQFYYAWCAVDQRPGVNRRLFFRMVEGTGFSRIGGKVWGVGLSATGKAMMTHAFLQPNENKRVWTEGDYTFVVEGPPSGGICEIEGRILCCVAGQLSTSEIAKRLKITGEEVATHLRVVYDRFSGIEGCEPYADLIINHWNREVVT